MPISDRLTSKLVSRVRLLALAPATCLLLSLPTSAQTSALAEAELQRRANNATEAQELLKKGDESYKAGKWSDAVAAYTGARDLLPDAPATAELRKAATERLVQSSVELARQQRRLGDVSGSARVGGTAGTGSPFIAFHRADARADGVESVISDTKVIGK